VGAAGIHPAWFPQVSMKLAAFLHRRRGGRVFTMFLHSSELLPGGGNPNFSTAQAVDRLVVKLRGFLTWLVKTGPVTGVTLSGLYDSLAQNPTATPGWSPKNPGFRQVVSLQGSKVTPDSPSSPEIETF